jgi:hypothetical protein
VFFRRLSFLADALLVGRVFPTIMPPSEHEEGEVDEGGSDGDSEENGEQPTSPPANPDGEHDGSGPALEEIEASEPVDSIAGAVVTRRRQAARQQQLAQQQAHEKAQQRVQQAKRRPEVESEEGESGRESSDGPNPPAPPASAGKGRGKGKEKEKDTSIELIRVMKKKRIEEKEYKPVQVIVDLTGKVSCHQPPPCFLLMPLQEFDSEIEDVKSLSIPKASELLSHNHWPQTKARCSLQNRLEQSSSMTAELDRR